MFNVNFLKRLAEQGVVAFVVGFGGVALAGAGSLTAAALSGALAAGLRAVYAVVVRNVGEADQPHVL